MVQQQARVGRPWVRQVARHFGIDQRTLRSRARPGPLVHARWVAMALMAEDGMPVGQIGRALGRDHSTVLHGLQQASRATVCADVAAIRLSWGQSEGVA